MKGHEPISAWTAFAYVAAGAYVLLTRETANATVFSVAMCLLALGTFVFHAFDTVWANDLDHAGMNAVYAALATAAVPGTGWVLIGLAAVLGVAAEYAADAPNRAMIGGLMWITIVSGLTAGSVLLTAAGTVLMAAGLAVWTVKRAKPLFGVMLTPDRAHGAWHLLTAAGTACLYLAVT